MHPLLASPRRMALYLVAWLPFARFLYAILIGGGFPPGVMTMVFAFLFADVCAFLSLAAFYSNRMAPLQTSTPWHIVRVQAAAAGITTALWLGIGSAAVAAMERAMQRSGLSDAFAAALPLMAALGIVGFGVSAAIHYLGAVVRQSREAERRALQLQITAREAELKTLRAQIDPHFLFNCLHSISALTTVDPAAARRMCVLLGDFLRKTLRLGSRELIPLREELALSGDYLAIEQVRLGGRLTVERTIDEQVLDTPVPPLLLQPLVENAITHGIGHLLEGGLVAIAVDRIDRLRVAVDSRKLLTDRHAGRAASTPESGTTPAAGTPDEIMYRHVVAAVESQKTPDDWRQYVRIRVVNTCDPDRPAGHGTGMGIENVRRRLASVYATEASLTVREHEQRFEAEVIVPLAFEHADAASADAMPALDGVDA